MRQLYLFTKEMSSEKSTSLSKVIPMINLMIDYYSQPQNQDQKMSENPIAKQLRNSIYEGLKQRFEKVEDTEIYCNATVFDPRFKNLVFSTKQKAAKAVSYAKAEAYEIANESEEILDQSNHNDEPM